MLPPGTGSKVHLVSELGTPASAGQESPQPELAVTYVVQVALRSWTRPYDCRAEHRGGERRGEVAK